MPGAYRSRKMVCGADRGVLDLPHLEPLYRTEFPHGLLHLALIALLRRLTGCRWTPEFDNRPARER